MTVKDIYQKLVIDHLMGSDKSVVTEMELLFLMNSNPMLKSLIQEYKKRLFSLHWDEIERLKVTLINIKKEQECSHSNQSQTPK